MSHSFGSASEVHIQVRRLRGLGDRPPKLEVGGRSMVTSPNILETHHIDYIDLKILYHWTFVKAKSVCDLSQKGGGRLYEYIHARAINNVLTQSRTVQKGGGRTSNSSENHTMRKVR